MCMGARHKMKIKQKTFNIITGEETITERNETAAETAERLASIAEYENLQAEAQAKAIARQAILDKLGLTAEEASILLS